MADVTNLQRLISAFFATHRIAQSGTVEERKEIMRMWLAAVRELSANQLATAIDRFNRECTEFPTPARLLSYAPGIIGDDDRAAVSWGEVLRAVRTVGAYRSVRFSDTITNVAIRVIGGWPSLCATAPDQMAWKKREFIDAYIAAAMSGIGDASHLVGVHEHQRSDRENVSVTVIETILPAHKVAGTFQKLLPQETCNHG